MDVEQQGRRQPLAPDQGEHAEGTAHGSPRARRLIDEAHALCESWLEAPVRACLLDAEHRLLGLADQARNHLDQQLHMNTRQQLQSQRELLERRFLAEVQGRFARLGQDTSEAAPATLTLLEVDEHEETAALEQAGARSEARHTPLLFELSYRFAALTSLPPREGEHLPLGAQSLAHAFLDALREHGMPVRHRLLLLESFDRMVVRHLASLYETVNQHLACEGILPYLHAYRIARPGEDRRQRAPAAIEMPTATPAAVSPPGSDNMLETLRALLAGHRVERANALAPALIANDDQLQQALAVLQNHLAGSARRIADGGQEAQLLHAQLLNVLNQGAVTSAQHTRLSREQEDTVQLVALLFEQMASAVQRHGQVHHLLGELQLPMLRMALADRSVFERDGHPARRLLSSIADTAGEWLDSGDADTDRSIALKLAQLVERARREPPSASLYDQLLGDIEQHLSVLARKAQIAERHQVEAMQGRERLEHARRRAAQLIAERFGAAPPRGLVRTLLERAWSDVLALTVLRHGEESDIFAARLRITDQLLGLAAIDDRTRLLEDIQTGLQQIGMQSEETAQVAQRLLGTPAPGDADKSDSDLTATGAAWKLKQHQRLGEQVAPPASAPPAEVTETLSGEEQDIHAHLLNLPFGTWFDFADASGQRIATQKLAWYSTVSGRCLFVTRRGTRGEELTLEQLARAIADGRAREATGDRENFFDRAMRALLGRLRQDAGQSVESRP